MVNLPLITTAEQVEKIAALSFDDNDVMAAIANKCPGNGDDLIAFGNEHTGGWEFWVNAIKTCKIRDSDKLFDILNDQSDRDVAEAISKLPFYQSLSLKLREEVESYG